MTVGVKCELCGYEIPWSDDAAALMAEHIKEAHLGKSVAPKESHHEAAQEKLNEAGK